MSVGRFYRLEFPRAFSNGATDWVDLFTLPILNGILLGKSHQVESIFILRSKTLFTRLPCLFHLYSIVAG